jgi:transcriptional regulator with XRE-family HTH domain
VQIPNLRELRELHGLTQKELADASGVSLRSVAGYEGGAHVRPNTARKLAQALNAEVADLVGVASYLKAEAPPFSIQPPLNGFEDERRNPTPSERRAVGALEDRCRSLEAFLKTAQRRSTPLPLEVWRRESENAVDIANIILPLIEREHVRPVLRPVAARFTELTYAVLDGMKDAGAAEEAERRREQVRRMNREIA